MGHSHDHNHTHDHAHDFSKVNTAFKLAIFLNIGFSLFELWAAWYAHSSSLLADAGHNLGDVLSLIMSWGALFLLKKKSSTKYSYGFKRSTILASFINAFILVVSASLIGYSAIERLIQGVFYLNEKMVILFASFGIFINIFSALLFKHGQKDLNVKTAFLHLMYDALISLGVVCTGILVYFTHQLWLDPLISLFIVIMIFYGSFGLLRQSLDLILDAVPHDIDSIKVRQFFLSKPFVFEVHDLHIWGLSTQETALTAHLIIHEKNFTDSELLTLRAELKKQFNIHHSTLQIETNKGHCDDEKKC